jgi:hypothetical protein
VKHKILTHPLQPSVVVATGNDHHLVAVGEGWFSTGFEVAFGNSIREVLERFSDELRATLDANEADSAKLGDDECLLLVRRIQQRLPVAEWADHLEDMDTEREAAE